MLDPLADLATADPELLYDLIDTIETDNAAVRSLLDRLTDEANQVELSDDEPEEPAAVEIPEAYQLLIDCRDEAEQHELFERQRRLQVPRIEPVEVRSP